MALSIDENRKPSGDRLALGPSGKRTRRRSSAWPQEQRPPGHACSAVVPSVTGFSGAARRRVKFSVVDVEQRVRFGEPG